MTFYGRNLREDLNSSLLVYCKRGNTKCSYKNCDSCNNFVDETTYIECSSTRKKMQKIRRETSCNSKNIIYVGYCIKCMKQGVG